MKSTLLFIIVPPLNVFTENIERGEFKEENYFEEFRI